MGGNAVVGCGDGAHAMRPGCRQKEQRSCAHWPDVCSGGALSFYFQVSASAYGLKRGLPPFSSV